MNGPECLRAPIEWGRAGQVSEPLTALTVAPCHWQMLHFNYFTFVTLSVGASAGHTHSPNIPQTMVNNHNSRSKGGLIKMYSLEQADWNASLTASRETTSIDANGSTERLARATSLLASTMKNVRSLARLLVSVHF